MQDKVIEIPRPCFVSSSTDKAETLRTCQPKSPLERIKAMCQGAEFDCEDARMRTRDSGSKAYNLGRADGFRAVLALIKTLEKK